MFEQLVHAGVNLSSLLCLAAVRCTYDSLLQANHFMGVTTSCVFCLSADIEKSPTASICGLLSNLFDVSLHSSFSRAPLLRVLLWFPLMTPLSLLFGVIMSALHTLTTPSLH